MRFMYCAKCGYESIFDSNTRTTINFTFMDSLGFELPISIADCPECGYELCGHVIHPRRTDEEREYQKYRIKAYTHPDSSQRNYIDDEEYGYVLASIAKKKAFDKECERMQPLIRRELRKVLNRGASEHRELTEEELEEFKTLHEFLILYRN